LDFFPAESDETESRLNNVAVVEIIMHVTQP
jgi:hypothetical protein